jgi:hypothetical protein
MSHLFKVEMGNPGSIHNPFFLLLFLVLNIQKHVRKYEHKHTHLFYYILLTQTTITFFTYHQNSKQFKHTHNKHL